MVLELFPWGDLELLLWYGRLLLLLECSRFNRFWFDGIGRFLLRINIDRIFFCEWGSWFGVDNRYHRALVKHFVIYLNIFDSKECISEPNPFVGRFTFSFIHYTTARSKSQYIFSILGNTDNCVIIDQPDNIFSSFLTLYCSNAFLIIVVYLLSELNGWDILNSEATS